MRELYGDCWDLWRTAPGVTGLCITSNGTVKRDGSCVMGRGIALQVKQRVPGFDSTLGERILLKGNHVHLFKYTVTKFFSFPVKHNWYEVADIELIKRSCKELMALLEPSDIVLLPRPGCGNGKLRWDDVRPAIAPLLDDRVAVVTWSPQ